MLENLLASIEASAPAAALRTSFVTYPLVNAAHVLGAGALVTCVWLMHLALGGAGTLQDSAVLFRRLAIVALGALALTGLALFSVKAGDYADNPAFRIKIALIAAGLANVAVFRLLSGGSPLLRRITVTVSVAVWPAVLVAGRFIGFV